MHLQALSDAVEDGLCDVEHLLFVDLDLVQIFVILILILILFLLLLLVVIIGVLVVLLFFAFFVLHLLLKVVLRSRLLIQGLVFLIA